MLKAFVIALSAWALVSAGIFSLSKGGWAWFWVILFFLVFGGVGLLWRRFAVGIVRKYAEQNIGFTFVEEGTAKFVMEGGKVVDTLIQMEGHRLNSKTGNVVWLLDGDGKVVPLEKDEKPSRKYPVYFGAWMFENPWVHAKRIFGYDWRRTVIDENGTKILLSSTAKEKKEMDSVPLQRDVYWAKVTGAETKDLIPVDVELLIAAQIVNPRKAIFETGGKPGVWLQVIIASMEGEITPVMSQELFADWIVKPNSVGDELYRRLQGYRDVEAEDIKTKEKHMVRSDVPTDPDVIAEFEQLHGVRIHSIRGLKIDPQEFYRELTTAGTRAELEGQAALIKARLTAAATSALATGNAEALAKMVEALRDGGDEAMALRTLEALEKSPMGGNLFMMMPELRERLRGVARKRR